MQVKELSSYPCFGYQSKHVHLKDAPKKDWQDANKGKILLSIPVVGQLAAIAGLILSRKEISKMPISAQIRFGVTALGLGIGFVPVDLVVTAKRLVQQRLMDKKAKAKAKAQTAE